MPSLRSPRGIITDNLVERLICLNFLHLKKNRCEISLQAWETDYELGSILTQLLLKEMDDDRTESRLGSVDHS
jgi:hypothetical protein